MNVWKLAELGKVIKLFSSTSDFKWAVLHCIFPCTTSLAELLFFVQCPNSFRGKRVTLLPESLRLSINGDLSVHWFSDWFKSFSALAAFWFPIANFSPWFFSVIVTSWPACDAAKWSADFAPSSCCSFGLWWPLPLSFMGRSRPLYSCSCSSLAIRSSLFPDSLASWAKTRCLWFSRTRSNLY